MPSAAHLSDFRFFIAFETDGQTIVLLSNNYRYLDIDS
jgi:hypothetical protein